MGRPRTPWQWTTPTAPKVTAYERKDRGGMLFLRWYEGGEVRRASLRETARRADGLLLPAHLAFAKARAQAKSDELRGVVQARRGPMTLAGARAAILDPVHGKWPGQPTPRALAVAREMDFAIAALGAEQPVAGLTLPTLRRLWRARIVAARQAGHDGLRPAEITVSAVLSVAGWCRAEERTAPGEGFAPEHWRQQLRADWQLLAGQPLPDVRRPRHTEDEMRRILAAAWEVDPRLALALAIGAELRLGQVLRLRRSDVDLGASPARVRVRGAGRKGGVAVLLTEGQDRALRRELATGYLAALEADGGDFPLFPCGQLTGGRSGVPRAVERHRTANPVGRRAALDWFHEAEQRAGVPTLPGRGWYGMRRASVDGAKSRGISREGLQGLGGWSDTQVPDRIYADQESEAAQLEAARVRAQIRGEAVQ